MKIAENCVVAIHYKLTDDQGQVIDSSEGREPLTYLHGAGNIIPGLERELAGCVQGDTKKVVVEPADGYGEVEDALIQTLPHDVFQGVEQIQPGMEFRAQGPNGQEQFVVVKDVSEEGVTIDANHALAGKVLNFDVSVEAVRAATAEEVDHGHAH